VEVGATVAVPLQLGNSQQKLRLVALGQEELGSQWREQQLSVVKVARVAQGLQVTSQASLRSMQAVEEEEGLHKGSEG
jgi:hypothetical protein